MRDHYAARLLDSGDKAKARAYFAELVRLTSASDTDHDEIRAAKMALADK